MKKNILILLLVFLFLAAPVFAQAQYGKLEIIKGSVAYQLPNQIKWVALNQKSINLEVGTIIQTKENSKAILKFNDGCKVLIDEMTLFKIQSREEKDNKNLFTIKLFGKTFVEVKKSGAQNNFKIQTPTALATIRGSKMLVSVENNLMTKVASAEGTIDVASTYQYKGVVLYVSDNVITLETNNGIQKIMLDKETIIPERGGSTVIKPNDRIAIYGQAVEKEASYNIDDNEIASLTMLPLTNKHIAAAGMMTLANLVTYTSPSELRFNSMTPTQQTSWVVQAPIYTPPAPPIAVPVNTMTTVAPGYTPAPPQPTPVALPVNLSQAASQTTVADLPPGQSAGEQASTSANEPATEPATKPGTNTTTTGSGTTSASTAPITSPPLISPSATTGNAQFNIQ